MQQVIALGVERSIRHEPLSRSPAMTGKGWQVCSGHEQRTANNIAKWYGDAVIVNGAHQAPSSASGLCFATAFKELGRNISALSRCRTSVVVTLRVRTRHHLFGLPNSLEAGSVAHASHLITHKVYNHTTPGSRRPAMSHALIRKVGRPAGGCARVAASRRVTA